MWQEAQRCRWASPISASAHRGGRGPPHVARRGSRRWDMRAPHGVMGLPRGAPPRPRTEGWSQGSRPSPACPHPDWLSARQERVGRSVEPRSRAVLPHWICPRMGRSIPTVESVGFVVAQNGASPGDLGGRRVGGPGGHHLLLLTPLRCPSYGSCRAPYGASSLSAAASAANPREVAEAASRETPACREGDGHRVPRFSYRRSLNQPHGGVGESRSAATGITLMAT
jgi:hypothetical protein